jgi:6-phosphogluconolactonase (cycloisomerase 2 family)
VRSVRATALAAALLALVRPAAAAPEAQLALLQDGQSLSGGARRSADVVASADGRHVYAAASGYVLALRREASGTLAFVEEHALATPGARIVAPGDGLGVLALASAPGVAVIVSFLRNPADGKLTGVENETQNLANSGHSLAVSRDGRLVYASSPGQDAVVVYDREPATGVLVFAQRLAESDADVSGLIDPTSLAVGPDDRHVYAAAFRRDGDAFREVVALLRREPDDALTFVESVDTPTLAGAPGLADLVIAPDGTEVLALDSGALPASDATAPAVLRYARDPADGRLSFAGAEPLVEPGFFAGTLEWLALRPDGERLFAGGLSLTEPAHPDGAVVAWARASGALTPLIRVDLGDGVTPGPITSRGAVSRDGRFVYTNLAQGVRVLVPEPGAAAAGSALATLAALAFSRRTGR